MFKNFVSLLSGHVSNTVEYFCVACCTKQRGVKNLRKAVQYLMLCPVRTSLLFFFNKLLVSKTKYED